MVGEIAQKAIDRQRPVLDEVSRYIWEHPEGAYREYEACEHTAKVLRDAGFTVEVGAFGVPTSIRASWGSGKPVIGLLGEYDALPGLSQKVVSHKEPIEGQRYGHGCGHNMLGTAHLGAALGLKAEMEEKGLPGTVVFYGCPGEEELTGKPFMARGGAFTDLDAAVAFHPGKLNTVITGTMTGLNSVKFHFHGITAHAGGDPHNGRSALDAVELTNVAANYLREHVKTDTRIHYTITEGGTAPNIVPDNACVWYYVRAMKREDVESVYRRLILCAEGAAHMTETRLEIEFLGGCYPTLNNKVLAKVLDDALREVPQEPWTEEELRFAAEVNAARPDQLAAVQQAHDLPEEMQLCTGVLPMDNSYGYGSTDVGDVAHIVPTATFNTACFVLGAPGHSWQNTACGGSSIGEKGMIYAAKAMAVFGAKLMENPALLEEARAEFKKSTGGKAYHCPIPAEVPVP